MDIMFRYGIDTLTVEKAFSICSGELKAGLTTEAIQLVNECRKKVETMASGNNRQARKNLERALEIARRENFVAHRGVYVAVTGPNLETRAEYRFLRTIGADVVGMSTVPEVIVAVHAGMRVLGLSIITDLCLPDALEPADIHKILAVAAEAEPKLRKIVRGVLAEEGGSR